MINRRNITGILCFWMTCSWAQFMTPHSLNRDSTVHTQSFIAEWSGEKASIETFSIIGNNLFGKAIHLYPEPHLRQFEFYYNSDGSIREMDIQFYDLNNTSIPLETKSGFLPKRIKMVSNNDVVDFRSVDNQGERQWVHNVTRMDFFGGWIPILAQWQWMTNQLRSGNLSSNLKFLNYVIGDYNLELIEKSKSEIIFKSDISLPIRFYINEKGVIDSINALGSPWNYKSIGLIQSILRILRMSLLRKKLSEILLQGKISSLKLVVQKYLLVMGDLRNEEGKFLEN